MNICPTCNNPSGFLKSGREKIFCSRGCTAKDKKNGRMKACKNCQKQFYISLSGENQKYCSRKCKNVCMPKRDPSKLKGNYIECPYCKNKRYVTPSVFKLNKSGMKFCSINCKGKAMKEGITNYGFIDEGKDKKINPYPRKQINGIRLKEHRRVMQEHLGRKLLPTELVHHINEDQTDNRIENLQIVSNEIHGKIHKAKYKKTH